jgi:hypothetical protein
LIEFGLEVRPGLVHREGQLVRVAGWILLIAGALLCATLVWATLGFLLMGVGLLSLQVAENNRKRASHPDVRDAYVDEPMVAAPPIAAPPPVPEPVPVPIVRREPVMEISAPLPSYDQLAWQRLVESDVDLARVSSVLADYGEQYVDALAKEYLAVVDKARLPEIVDGIIARASRSVAPRGNRRLLDDARPPKRVAESSAAAPRPDRQPRPLPETKIEAKLKVSETLPDSVSSPVEPAKQETVDAPVQPPIAVEPALDAGDRNKTIISADEELTAMLGRLSSDAATPRN